MKKSTILTIVIGAILLVWVALFARHVFEKPGSLSHLRRIAAQINGRDKAKDHGMTELTGARAEEKRLTLTYKYYKFRADEVDPTSLPVVREVMRHEACSKKELRELLDADVTLRFVVNGNDDKQLLTSDVLKWECSMDAKP